MELTLQYRVISVLRQQRLVVIRPALPEAKAGRHGEIWKVRN